ncbi:kinase-like domain-containing protein [Crassisporium funariophilum]|nr:kinase-like domain-containing protein [Crassisporium funariophilum]
MATSNPNSPSSRALVALPFTYSNEPPQHSHSSPQPNLRSNLASSSSSSMPPLSGPEQEQWQPILHASNQVVLYNPRSHALSIASTSAAPYPPSAVVVARRKRRDDLELGGECPYCKQTLPTGFEAYDMREEGSGRGWGHASHGLHREDDEDEGRWEPIFEDADEGEGDEEGHIETLSTDPAYHSRASDYFQLLAIANERARISDSSVPPGAFRVGVGVGDGDASIEDDTEGWRRQSRRDRSDTVTSSYSGGSQRTTPPAATTNPNGKGNAFTAEKMAEGYFKTFFQEEYKLGMGANGTVYLCQHVLDGNPLGHFAVKKIAVGESHSYLLKILREVRLLERLHHPNIITYHHAWLESAQFSSFGPKIPTLHVLMQWAEGGSLDDFIDVRLGRKPAHIHMHPLASYPASSASSSAPPTPSSPTQDLPPDPTSPTTPTPHRKHPRFVENDDQNNNASPRTRGRKNRQEQEHAASPQDPHSRSARIRAFRAYQKAPAEEKDRMKREMEVVFGQQEDGGAMAGRSGVGGGARRGEWTAVHLLSATEVKSLFKDVVEGLGFLHDKSILHLDLKPGNVLLTWDEGKLIPRAMLSDFGTSRDMINSSRVQRSGNTGTLEYTAPESLPSPLTGLLLQIDSKADMWSLGMILHKLLFFKLPYRYAAGGDANGEPISRNEEGEKMDRLEKEVLEYAGFKSNPNLVAGFEARKLPRAFLVLLENLLHKTPVSRPSCERVAAAIRDGKLDPLEDSQTGSLPLSRPWMDTGTGDGGNRTSSSPSGSGNGGGEIALAPEKARLLALPSPIDVLGPEEGSWRSWMSTKGWIGVGKAWGRWILGRSVTARAAGIRKRSGEGGTGSRGRRRIAREDKARRWRSIGLRVMRSFLLIAKVMTIPRLCPDPMTRPRPMVAAIMLGAAVADTVLDHDGSWERGVVVSLGLALVHVGILRWVTGGVGGWGWAGWVGCVPHERVGMGL